MKTLALACFFLLIASSSSAQWVRTDQSITENIQRLYRLDEGKIVALGNTESFVWTTETPTWTKLSFGGSDIVADSGTWYAVSLNAVVRSTNQGLNWSQVNLPGVNYQYCIISTPSGLFIGTDTGVVRSQDNGNTWTKFPFGTPPFQAAVSIAAVGNSIFASLSGEGVYRSTDQGGTWSNVSSTINSAKLWSYGNTLYAGSFGGLDYSTDEGVTWIHTSVSGPILGLMTYDSVLVAGTWTSVLISTDQGVTWTDKRTGLPSGMISVFDFLTQGSTVYAATDKGLFEQEISTLLPVSSVEETKESSLQLQYTATNVQVISSSMIDRADHIDILGVTTPLAIVNDRVDIPYRLVKPGSFVRVTINGTPSILRLR